MVKLLHLTSSYRVDLTSAAAVMLSGPVLDSRELFAMFDKVNVPVIIFIPIDTCRYYYTPPVPC